MSTATRRQADFLTQGRRAKETRRATKRSTPDASEERQKKLSATERQVRILSAPKPDSLDARLDLRIAELDRRRAGRSTEQDDEE